jgi:hypothetical protein
MTQCAVISVRFPALRSTSTVYDFTRGGTTPDTDKLAPGLLYQTLLMSYITVECIVKLAVLSPLDDESE